MATLAEWWEEFSDNDIHLMRMVYEWKYDSLPTALVPFIDVLEMRNLVINNFESLSLNNGTGELLEKLKKFVEETRRLSPCDFI